MLRVRAEKDDLEGLRNSARRLRYLASREAMLAQLGLDAQLAQAPGLSPSASRGSSALAELDSITAEYKSLCLRLSDPGSLATCMANLERQRARLAAALER
jgi:hypothetical protein